MQQHQDPQQQGVAGYGMPQYADQQAAAAQMYTMMTPEQQQQFLQMQRMYPQYGGMITGMPYMMSTQIPQQMYTRMPMAGPGEMVEEEPVYVNAKQYHRIMIRRQKRAKLAAKVSKTRKAFLHESRHKHAMRRKRGPGGRFLRKEEIEKLEKDNKDKSGKRVDDSAGRRETRRRKE